MGMLTSGKKVDAVVRKDTDVYSEQTGVPAALERRLAIGGSNAG
jgi:hypothetical protein